MKTVNTGGTGGFSAVVAPGKTTGWAFDGYDASSGPAAWKWSGASWTKVAFPGKADEAVVAAAATSPSDVWAFDNKSFDASSRIIRWNGTKWSVFKSFTGGIDCVSVLTDKDVWVFGLGGSTGMPSLGVWHDNGHTWSKLAGGQFGLGAGQQLSTDATGGLWLPMPGVGGQQSFVVHYSAGKLTKAILPIPATKVVVNSIARVPGTVDQIAGGLQHAANLPGDNVVGVVLEYS